MSNRRSMIFNIGNSTPETFAEIFGANLYDDWDFGDAAYVTTVSGAVSQLRSKVSSRHFNQSTAASRPLLVANQINGKSVGRFDGSNDWMDFTNTTSYQFLHESQGCVIAIFKRDMAGTTDYMRIFSTAGFTSSRGFFIQAAIAPDTGVSFAVYRGVNGTSGPATSQSFSDLQWHSAVCVLDLTNATVAERIRLRRDRNFNNTSAVANAVGIGNHLNPSIGRLSGGASYYFKGDIARIIVINTKPTESQLIKVQNRILYEYGVLPS